MDQLTRASPRASRRGAVEALGPAPSLSDIAEFALRVIDAECSIIICDQIADLSTIAVADLDPTLGNATPTVDLVDPLVARRAGFKLYIGLPIYGAPELKIGTLAVIGKIPQNLDRKYLRFLRDLANMASITLTSEKSRVG